MNDKQLIALLTAARLRSLNKAAEELGYTQSGMTYIIDRLEDELGCWLMERSHTGVRLTAEGEALRPYIDNYIAAGTLLKDECARLGRTAPEIRIGTYASIAKHLLPTVIRDYCQDYPDTQIKIQIGRHEITQWLESGVIDMALVDENMGTAGEWTRILTDSFCLVSASCSGVSGGPVQQEELRGQTLILPQSDEMRSHIMPWVGDMPQRVIYVDSDDDDALLSLVEQGLGLAVLPELSVRGCSANVIIRELTPPISRTIGMAVSHQAKPEIKSFMRYITKLTQAGSAQQ